MKALVILSIICFILFFFLGLVWCISSIHNLCGAIKSILETMRVYDNTLGLEE